MGGTVGCKQRKFRRSTFTIMEWKPKSKKQTTYCISWERNCVRHRRIKFKTYLNSMDLMKIDMGGPGTVIGLVMEYQINCCTRSGFNTVTQTTDHLEMPTPLVMSLQCMMEQKWSF